MTSEDARAFLGVDDTGGRDAAIVAREAFKQGLFRHGLAVANDTLARHPERFDLWDIKAQFLAALGFHRAMLACLEQLVAVHPRALARALELAEWLGGRGRWRDAIALLGRVSSPPAADAALAARHAAARSLAHNELEDGEPALAAADAALAFEPRSIDALYNRGRALCLLGRLDEARISMCEILELEPGHADAFRVIGIIDTHRAK
jgi:tetratricopeptide (TPR) repeat protein